MQVFRALFSKKFLFGVILGGLAVIICCIFAPVPVPVGHPLAGLVCAPCGRLEQEQGRAVIRTPVPRVHYIIYIIYGAGGWPVGYPLAVGLCLWSSVGGHPLAGLVRMTKPPTGGGRLVCWPVPVAVIRGAVGRWSVPVPVGLWAGVGFAPCLGLDFAPKLGRFCGLAVN